MVNHLKLTNNKKNIINEVDDGKFNLDFSDHILHLKSFIDKDLCKQVVDELNSINNTDKSSQYSDGLMNDEADSYFDPDIESLEIIKKKIFDDGIKEYAEKVRAFNWSYYNNKRFRYSEMMVRRYHPDSELSYHHDDIIIEIFPHWFSRRQNIITANIYFNDSTDYEGGDLKFAASNKLISPSIGDVVLFPSNWMYYHKVTKITSGTRYAGTLWFFYGSDKKVGKRQSHQDKFAK